MDIYQRYATFAPDMEVPSAFLNNLQDRDIDIAAKAWVDPAFLLLCVAFAPPKEVEFSYNVDGTIDEMTSGTGAPQAAFAYTDGVVSSITLTHDTEVRILTFTYNADGTVQKIRATRPA